MLIATFLSLLPLTGTDSVIVQAAARPAHREKYVT